MYIFHRAKQRKTAFQCAPPAEYTATRCVGEDVDSGQSQTSDVCPSVRLTSDVSPTAAEERVANDPSTALRFLKNK